MIGVWRRFNRGGAGGHQRSFSALRPQRESSAQPMEITPLFQAAAGRPARSERVARPVATAQLDRQGNSTEIKFRVSQHIPRIDWSRFQNPKREGLASFVRCLVNA